ncbi:hypothetical protein C5X33_24235 [Klebsiella pneumoniae subsp. pneumoniae]|nr:hypothetical protein C5X33_24235 [Klebsiella pneumoniae subsp. pneumoniae]
MMSLWDALRMNMMISYQELVRTFPSTTSKFSSSAIACQDSSNLGSFSLHLSGSQLSQYVLNNMTEQLGSIFQREI